MLGRFVSIARAGAVALTVIGTGCLCAVTFALGYVFLVETLWPLEPNEAGGPQFARGMVVLFLLPTGFIVGCALAIWGCSVVSRRFRRSHLS
jgi:hypothetical protein